MIVQWVLSMFICLYPRKHSIKPSNTLNCIYITSNLTLPPAGFIFKSALFPPAARRTRELGTRTKGNLTIRKDQF